MHEDTDKDICANYFSQQKNLKRVGENLSLTTGKIFAQKTLL